MEAYSHANPLTVLTHPLVLRIRDKRAETLELATSALKPFFMLLSMVWPLEQIEQARRRWNSTNGLVAIPLALVISLSMGEKVRGALAGIGLPQKEPCVVTVASEFATKNSELAL